MRKSLYDSDERGWRSRMKKRVGSSREVINWSKGGTRGGGGCSSLGCWRGLMYRRRRRNGSRGGRR
ncbi:hypothetical protein Taro_041149 [Colocasia esculenta]|uniref:Uncharacterized protein n=1 Tax=Colocasia esculenta TaxID=4460 RepID=A0A843WWH7_COLES|nr:hypothetical protein [Colocasia esculenta]